MLPKLQKLTFEVEFQQSESPYQGRSGDSFFIKFHELRQSLISNLQEFVTVEVLPRQPPPHLMSVPGRFNKNAYLDLRKNKMVEFPRRNSFEIYVDNFHLFSRLETGTWPDASNICEWALRVAQKLVDLQIEKDEGLLKEQLQLMGKDVPIEGETNNRKLPLVSKVFDQTLKNRPEKGQIVNYYPRSRYTSLREDGLMPYGVDPMNHTQKMPYLNRSTKTRMKVNSIDKDLRTISRGAYTRSRDQSFHWDLKQRISAPKFVSRNNDALINTFDGTRTPNVELSPLPAVHERLRQQIQEEPIHLPKMEIIQLKLSQNTLNCYKKYYKIITNKAIKISGDQLWSPLLCQTPLPLIGQYCFQIFPHVSNQNQVQIGIAPLSYYPHLDQPDKPDNLLIFNCGNGQIKDAKHSNFAAETHWREGGMKITQKTPFCIKVIVNIKNKIIEWHINDTISASAKIPSQYSSGFRAFISLYHNRDIVFLNRPGDSLNQSIDLLLQLKQQIKGKQKITTNAFAQTGEAGEVASPQEPKQIIQNRIYPNFKQKQIISMVNEITQTTPIIQGRIKKQRLHRFIDKNQSEKQKEKEKQKDFTLQDVKTYKTIIANDQGNSNNEWNVNIPQKQQNNTVVTSIIDVKIHKTQSIEEIEKKIKQALHKQEVVVEDQHQIMLKDILEEEMISKQQLQKEEIINPMPILSNEENTQAIEKIAIIQQQTPSSLPNHQIAIIQQSASIKAENHQPHAIQRQYLQATIQQIQPRSFTSQQQTPQKQTPLQIIQVQQHSPILENQLPSPIQDELKQISESGEAVRWQGVYQQGSFKLKTTHHI